MVHGSARAAVLPREEGRVRQHRVHVGARVGRDRDLIGVEARHDGRVHGIGRREGAVQKRRRPRHSVCARRRQMSSMRAMLRSAHLRSTPGVVKRLAKFIGQRLTQRQEPAVHLVGDGARMGARHFVVTGQIGRVLETSQPDTR